MQNAKQERIEDEGKLHHWEKAKQPKWRKIQSVERSTAAGIACRWRNCLNSISKALDIKVGTCHYLLSTLMDRGFVAQPARDRRYRLGNKILELSRSHMRQCDSADIAILDHAGAVAGPFSCSMLSMRVMTSWTRNCAKMVLR
ncbi:MAG: hypothetical protein KDI63_14780 [Gammaproteobacteria bacterium]|nr:hypothetical protein [Gammaproteobacteria bacterium]